MAFTCGFFNSENGDRKYNAEQMSTIFDGIIADGVFTTIGDHMAVSAGTGMQVLVGTGKAWFDHTWNVNDAAYPLAIAASDVTLSRIDAIVLETNHSDSVRLNKLRVVQGTIASSPAKPTLTNSEKVHQHPLAWVTVAPGVTKIAASAIENAVGTSACPFVTGIIATTAIDDLFNQWNGEFDEWFDNLKAQLSDNVVANLQRQIDQKVAKADVATTADIEAGTSTTKWVSPKGLKDSGIDGYKVGDVLNTIRTDLGDKWALCNGDIFNKSSAPLLFDLTSGGSNIFINKNGYRKGIFYVNGYWVTFLSYPSGSVPKPGSIFVTNDILGSWTEVSLPVVYYGVDIDYHDGIYVILGQNSSGSTVVLTATNILGPWTKNTSVSTGNYPTGMTYGDGVWSIGTYYQSGGSYYSSAVEYYTTDPTGVWTSVTLKSMESTQKCSISALGYGNGKFVFSVATSGNSPGYLQCEIYVRDINSISTYTNQLISDVTGKWTMSDLAYHNGLWVGVNGSTVFTASDPSGAWTKLTKGSGLGRIAYENGVWYFPGANSTLYSTPDINADWSSTKFEGQTLGLGAIAIHDGQIMMDAGDTYFAVNNFKHLPTISINGCHSYVRKK